MSHNSVLDLQAGSVCQEAFESKSIPQKTESNLVILPAITIWSITRVLKTLLQSGKY